MRADSPEQQSFFCHEAQRPDYEELQAEQIWLIPHAKWRHRNSLKEHTMKTFSAMQHLGSARQLATRDALSKQKRSAFDIEFGRLRIRSWIFILLWLTVGNFGAHYLYLRFKREYDELSHFSGLYVVGFLWLGVFLYAIQGGGQHAALTFLLLYAFVFCHGLVMLATGHIRRSNDEIASRIAFQLGKN